jgi:hypothetical protein
MQVHEERSWGKRLQREGGGGGGGREVWMCVDEQWIGWRF